MHTLFNFLRRQAGHKSTTSPIETLTIPTQAPPDFPWLQLGSKIGSQVSDLLPHLIHNEQGAVFCQFPNLDPDWATLDLIHFVPEHEFSDCVFGELLGSKVKLFKAEYSYPYPETLRPIGGGWL